MKENRLVIGIPSTDTWEAGFAMSLLFMTNRLVAHPYINGKPTQLRIHNRKGSILPQSRHKILSEALKTNSTHLLFIDSDQTFPADLAHRLMQHQKKVVGCNIATKTLPSNPTARQFNNTRAGELVYTHEDSKGLEQVWRLGCGIMLIDLLAMRREGLRNPPWFDITWHEETQDYRGEDWFFCERLEQAGIKIYVDHELSWEVGHIGKMNYGHDVVEVPMGRRKGDAA